jgi:hypothetical protein
MPGQPGESPAHRMDGPCGDDVRTGWLRPDDDRTTRREERGPRGGVPHAAPMGGDGPEPHFSDSQ